LEEIMTPIVVSILLLVVSAAPITVTAPPNHIVHEYISCQKSLWDTTLAFEMAAGDWVQLFERLGKEPTLELLQQYEWKAQETMKAKTTMTLECMKCLLISAALKNPDLQTILIPKEQVVKFRESYKSVEWTLKHIHNHIFHTFPDYAHAHEERYRHISRQVRGDNGVLEREFFQPPKSN
jgi:hypothetical protein